MRRKGKGGLMRREGNAEGLMRGRGREEKD